MMKLCSLGQLFRFSATINDLVAENLELKEQLRKKQENNEHWRNQFIAARKAYLILETEYDKIKGNLESTRSALEQISNRVEDQDYAYMQSLQKHNYLQCNCAARTKY